METYIGYIKSPQDALVIFEACRQGHLNRVQRRLSSKERTQIRSGSIFAFDESEAGMRRWTDGLTWSPSRVLGSFLTYRELDTKRRPRRPQSPSSSHHHHHHHHHQHHHHHHQHQQQNGNKLSCQSMCSYKQDGLIKQSFSICTADNQKLHLISYYNKRDVLNGRLQQPSMDPALGSIVVPKGVYPDLNPLDTSGGHSATLHNMHINMDLLPSPTYSPFHPQLSSSSSSSSSQHYACLPTLLPIQEIAWEKIPSSEDQRQLQAIQGLLKL
ncbi:Gti1/Pac2 family-domain-containing protein [Chlamydoabsidia padenii]|nr:Gti1/Pac2 family-domain-containing protein [Chlamydoabsidia padenii]